MVRLCPRVQEFWQTVVADMGSISEMPLKPLKLDPMVLLLALPITTHTKLFIFYTAFYARKTILLSWKAQEPPRTSTWKELINATLPLYKLTYMRRNLSKGIL